MCPGSVSVSFGRLLPPLPRSLRGINFSISSLIKRNHQRNPPSPDLLSNQIDKSVLTIAEPKRLRDKAHLRFVASQACLICGRQPSDPHHLRFAQPRALGLKVSDEFTVPLCRGHHRQLHQAGNEVAWWEALKINALPTAKDLWEQTHAKGGHVNQQIQTISADVSETTAKN
jgi:hypothetical protein